MTVWKFPGTKASAIKTTSLSIFFISINSLAKWRMDCQIWSYCCVVYRSNKSDSNCFIVRSSLHTRLISSFFKDANIFLWKSIDSVVRVQEVKRAQLSDRSSLWEDFVLLGHISFVWRHKHSNKKNPRQFGHGPYSVGALISRIIRRLLNIKSPWPVVKTLQLW